MLLTAQGPSATKRTRLFRPDSAASQGLSPLLNNRNSTRKAGLLQLAADQAAPPQAGSSMPPVQHGSVGLSPRELFGRTDEEQRHSGSDAEAGPSTARAAAPLDAAVAQRISLASLRAETQQLAGDEQLARGLRSRWLGWALREEKNARPLQAVPPEVAERADELFKQVPSAFRCVAAARAWACSA